MITNKDANARANALFVAMAEEVFAAHPGPPRPLSPPAPDTAHGLAIGDRVAVRWCPDNDGGAIDAIGTVTAIHGPNTRDDVEVTLDPVRTDVTARECTRIASHPEAPRFLDEGGCESHADKIAEAIDAKVTSALAHSGARTEAVLAALVAHCGGIDAAIAAGVAHSPGKSATVHLGDHIIWRGWWDDAIGDPLFPPSPPRMEWREAWGPACPADVKERAR